ncbi:MAG: response regulator [Sandaracinus sp.]|nr:response regulator [Sandaracinus sp.]
MTERVIQEPDFARYLESRERGSGFHSYGEIAPSTAPRATTTTMALCAATSDEQATGAAQPRARREQVRLLVHRSNGSTACSGAFNRNSDASRTSISSRWPREQCHLRENATCCDESSLGAVLECTSALFDVDGGNLGAWLALPLRAADRPIGLLLARKVSSLLPYAESLPEANDHPFLRLVASHIEGALEGTRLRNRLATVLEHLPVALFVLRNARVVGANAATRRVLAWPDREPLEGSALLDLVPHEDHVLFEGFEADVARGGPLRLLGRRLLARDGSIRPVELTALALRYEGAPATLVLAEDVAERMRTRTELAFTERLATVGSLAAGVAHEVNNPLTFVLFHLERLAHRVPPDMRDSARAALDGATRIRDIVRDLQTFARDDSPKTEPVEVHAVLEKVLALAAAELRYRARVVRSFEASHFVLASEGRLAQIFLNLVINASHAMSEDVDTNELRIATRDEPERVVIEISDTGVGIAPPDLARIFEPFYSTKTSNSSGLGLSICRNLVESFGGTIEVTSALDQGTRFTIRLPTARAGELPERPGPMPRPGYARVLVIDDDPRLLAILGEVLEGTYDVTTALGGASAISRLEREPFDAVVCDLMMPDVSGVAVHGWATLHRPELARRMVFLTGGAVTRESQEFVARTVAPVVPKPASPEELIDAIEYVRNV